MKKNEPHFLFWPVLLILTSLLFGACASAPQNPAPQSTAASPAEPTQGAPAAAVQTQTTGWPVTLTDGLGRSVTLDTPPQRIISLAPSVTEMLFAVGAGAQVVGRDQFSDYPEEAQSRADIGGGFGELNTEQIVALNPDFVISSSLTSPDQIQALENLKLNVYLLDNPKDLDGMFSNLITLGQITGHDMEAQTLVTSLKDRLANLQEKLSGVTERPTVFYELDSTDPNAPWTPGPGSFLDQLLTLAGGENMGNIQETEWGQINIETLLQEDPDYILLGDATWGGVTVESVLVRPGWETLTAVKEKRVYPFDDNLVSRPGPRMLDGIEALARLLHPELFE